MKISKINFKQFLPSLRHAASSLKGSVRRMFLGRLALNIGRGGKVLVSKEVDISRVTLDIQHTK